MNTSPRFNLLFCSLSQFLRAHVNCSRECYQLITCPDAPEILYPFLTRDALEVAHQHFHLFHPFHHIIADMYANITSAEKNHGLISLWPFVQVINYLLYNVKNRRKRIRRRRRQNDRPLLANSFIAHEYQVRRDRAVVSFSSLLSHFKHKSYFSENCLLWNACKIFDVEFYYQIW